MLLLVVRVVVVHGLYSLGPHWPLGSNIHPSVSPLRLFSVFLSVCAVNSWVRFLLIPLFSCSCFVVSLLSLAFSHHGCLGYRRLTLLVSLCLLVDVDCLGLGSLVLVGSTASPGDLATQSFSRLVSHYHARPMSQRFGRVIRSKFGSIGHCLVIGHVRVLVGPCRGRIVSWTGVGKKQLLLSIAGSSRPLSD